MKTVLPYIDHNKRHLARHPVFERLRGGGADPRQRQRLLDAMASMLAELVPVVERGADEDTGYCRPLCRVGRRPDVAPGLGDTGARHRLLAHRLARLVWLARDAARPAVVRAVVQSGRMLSAYLSKLCECEAVDPGPALRIVAEWDLVCERLPAAGSAEALAAVALDESLRQQAMNLVDAVFELVEGGCDDLLVGIGPADDAAAARGCSAGLGAGLAG